MRRNLRAQRKEQESSLFLPGGQRRPSTGTNETDGKTGVTPAQKPGEAGKPAEKPAGERCDHVRVSDCIGAPCTRVIWLHFQWICAVAVPTVWQVNSCSHNY